jgi:hypothetical protein
MEEAVYALPQEKYDLLVGASRAKQRRLDTTSSVPLGETVHGALFDRIQTLACLTKREILDARPS